MLFTIKYRENGDSKQMYCMWSIDDPPDIIEGTEPYEDIEVVFGISIGNDEAMLLYDMHLEEVARRIMELQDRQETKE